MITPSVATVTYYDYGAALPVLRPLDAYPVTLIVQDLRPDVLSRRKIPLYVGSAENGFGNARDVFNRDDCPVPVSVHRTPHCKSLAESVFSRLKSSTAVPEPNAARGLLLVEIKTWETHANNDLRLDYAIDVYLRSSAGTKLGSASIQGSNEAIDVEGIGRISFTNHVEKEERLSKIVAGVLDDKLAKLLKGPIQSALFSIR